MKRPTNRLELIKDHFEKEAAVFDELFFKVMPRYEDMTGAVVDALPFKKTSRLNIVDLGCGTGNLTQKMVAVYPNAKIACLDMATNMIKMAKSKLGKNRNISFWQGDIRDFDYSGKYDAIVSSMVLHHVEGKDKPDFYRKLHKALRKGGVFVTIDIFLSSNPYLQKMFMDKWMNFMKASGLPKKRVLDMIARHQREDRPVVFEDELSMLRKAGFRSVEVILKHFNFAVYGGIK